MRMPCMPGLREGLVATMLLLVVGCGSTSESQQVADRFMQAYYTQMNVAEAAALSIGAAHTKLEGELVTLQGVPPDTSGRPRLSVSLAGNPVTTATTATYVYRVAADTSDVGVVTTTLGLTNEAGTWRVSSFEEQESPSGS